MLNPNDPRVRKTRRGLQSAFIRLILQKGYDAISIQDIANEAETARITFYRHYRDKEDLLTDCLNSLYTELVEKTQQIDAEALERGYSPIETLYEHMEEQEQLYRILFSTNGTQTVIGRMRHFMSERALVGIERFLATNPNNPLNEVPLDIVANHIANAHLGLAIWWLDHGKPYPPRYMAQISLWLSLQGFLKSIGVHDFDIPKPILADFM